MQSFSPFAIYILNCRLYYLTLYTKLGKYIESAIFSLRGNYIALSINRSSIDHMHMVNRRTVGSEIVHMDMHNFGAYLREFEIHSSHELGEETHIVVLLRCGVTDSSTRITIYIQPLF